MTTENRIAALEAKDEIRELTARYCHAVVDGDAAAVAGLFCADGVFKLRNTETAGRDALREMYTSAIGGRTHKPFVQNHVIDLHGDDEASGRCSAEIRIFQDGEAITAAGHYLDTYRKEDGRWRFAAREFLPYHFAPVRQGWTE